MSFFEELKLIFIDLEMPVYIFGSALNNLSTSNDIDLLVVTSKTSRSHESYFSNLKLKKKEVYKKFGKSVDLIVLNQSELSEFEIFEKAAFKRIV